MFDVTNLQRIATAGLGALILTIACVGAAVAPARAVETAAVVNMLEAKA